MKIEVIKWVDTFGCPQGWEFEDELECKAVEVTSVGFVFKESDSMVVLVPHRSSAERPQVAGYIGIPVRQIISREVVAEK